MAHYAKVRDGKVINVIAAEADFFDTFIDETPGEWIQTSYNTKGGVHKLGGTPLRKNYAGIGYTYDKNLDAFIPPRLFPSWTLNETTCLWEPPITKPNTGRYKWDEELYQSDNTKGWVEVTDDES
jgi:hypothetical protein|tara:strand:- start:132 stop:506 length:375 start_codon:yes stop_codon:yes gene_type:complete